jgi:hypothetical protein
VLSAKLSADLRGHYRIPKMGKAPVTVKPSWTHDRGLWTLVQLNIEILVKVNHLNQRNTATLLPLETAGKLKLQQRRLYHGCRGAG